MQNSNGQRHGGAALKNKSTGAPGWRPPTNKYTQPQTTTSSTSAASSKHLQPIQQPRVGYPLIHERTEHHLAIRHPKYIRRITPQLPELLCLLNKQKQTRSGALCSQDGHNKNKRKRQEYTTFPRVEIKSKNNKRDGNDDDKNDDNNNNK
jgi:hypothetical protein